jgi:hypothetical protein
MAGSTALLAAGVYHLRGAGRLLCRGSSRGITIMSASAEVYISIDNENTEIRGGIQSLVDTALYEYGFDTANKERYNIGRYQSGLIIEAKSYGCSWEIFDQAWAEKLVRDIAVLDETANVELYVYNLEREADLVMRTSDLFSENYTEKDYRRSPVGL